MSAQFLPLTAPAALTCLVVAVEMQVRLIEEPNLLRVHGTAYHRYAAVTGRFVPKLGRLAHPAEVSR